MADALPQARLHSTLTRKTEPLEPLQAGKVSIDTCGSTVYKYAHIGNLRTYSFGDLLHRTLEYLGYEVRYVKNITDVGQPRNFRYLALTAHYRSKLDFTADALHAAASGLAKLRRAAAGADSSVDLSAAPMANHRRHFADAVADDFATPRALAVAHEVPSAPGLAGAERSAMLLDFDRVLGLDLGAAPAA